MNKNIPAALSIDLAIALFRPTSWGGIGIALFNLEEDTP